MRNPKNRILPIVCAAFAASAGAAEEPPTVSLVNGTSKPNNTKPASIFYTNDGYGSASHAINAALVSREMAIRQLDIPGTLATGASFSAGISKDTVAKSPSDSRTLNANLAGHWNQVHRVHTVATFALEDDSQNGDRSNSWRLDAEVDSRWLKWFKEAGIGERGAYLKVFPSAGLYQRRITSTSDETKTPKGHYGGPYVSVHLIGSLGDVTSDAKWFERIGADIALFRIRDSSVSGGYTSASYNYATGTISYALHDYTADRKRVWKPSIGLTRNVGIDRLNNLPRKAETSVGLQLSYGL